MKLKTNKRLNEKMRIFHIEFAALGKCSVGGGDTVLSEFVKYLVSKKIDNIIVTTDNGKETYIKLGLKEGKFISYRIIKTFDFEMRHHKFVSYVQRVNKAIRLVNNLKLEEKDKVIVYNELFPNSIPMHFLAKRNKKIPIFFWIHMISPNIFKGFEGEFTNKLQFPKLRVVHYKLNQLLAAKIFPKNGRLILNDPYYWKFFGKYVPREKGYVIKNFGWANLGDFKKTKKKYDLAWAGRFHEQKGIFEIIDILRKVKEKKKDVSLLLLGDGDEKIKRKFLDEIKNNNLQENIDYKGFVIGKEKDKLIKKSKVFILTSYYEGLPLTISEITNLGIPIVAYNLPVFDVAEKSMTRVGIKDNKAFSEKILRLLSQKAYYESKVKETIEYAKMHNKKIAGKEIFSNIILRDNDDILKD